MSSFKNIVVCVLLPGIAACGSERVEPISQARSAIVDGIPDQTHDAVVAIIRYGTGICTGASLTPDLIVTGRHCVSALLMEPTSACSAVETTAGTITPGVTLGGSWASQLSIAVGDVIDESAPRFEVVEALFPPDAPEGALWCGRDVALLRIAQAIPNSVLATPRLEEPVSLQEPFTAIGFGYTAAGDKTSFGIRRTHAATVAWTGQKNPRTFAETVAGEWASENAFVCQGDSGGPALDAEGKIIGIASRNGGTYCSGRGIYQGLLGYADWLRGAVQEDAKTLGIAAPEWATEPSIDAGAADSGSDAAPASDAEPPVQPEPPAPSPSPSSSGGCQASAGTGAGQLGFWFFALLAGFGRRRTVPRNGIWRRTTKAQRATICATFSALTCRWTAGRPWRRGKTCRCARGAPRCSPISRASPS